LRCFKRNRWRSSRKKRKKWLRMKKMEVGNKRVKRRGRKMRKNILDIYT
jgi:hypothetical protein